MPQRRNAIKDLRKNTARHLHNLQIKTDLKKAIKKFTIAAGAKKADAPALLKEIYKKFDKAAKHNRLLHKKTAARRKSRFAKLLAAQKLA